MSVDCRSPKGLNAEVLQKILTETGNVMQWNCYYITYTQSIQHMEYVYIYIYTYTYTYTYTYIYIHWQYNIRENICHETGNIQLMRIWEPSGRCVAWFTPHLPYVHLLQRAIRRTSESTFSGWWYTYPSETYLSIGVMTFHYVGNQKMVQTTNQIWYISSPWMKTMPISSDSQTSGVQDLGF